MRTNYLLVTTFAALLSTSGYAVSAETPSDPQLFARQAIAQQRAIDEARAPVKSAGDLRKYLQTEAPSSPLNLLTPDAKERFLSSLVFSEKGLASFNFQDLESQLTASQIYDVLSLFGMQATTNLISGAAIKTEADRLIASPLAVNQPPNCDGGISDDPRCRPEGGGGGAGGGGGGDHNNYMCAGPQAHTCIPNTGSICTHNC